MGVRPGRKVLDVNATFVLTEGGESLLAPVKGVQAMLFGHSERGPLQVEAVGLGLRGVAANSIGQYPRRTAGQCPSSSPVAKVEPHARHA